MKTIQKYFAKWVIALMLWFLLIIPGSTFAHQPRVPVWNETQVSDPEISKAYYSQLHGTPQIYTIVSASWFALYINILVPDISGQKKDISVRIIKNWKSETPFALLDGNQFNWTKMFEPFGYDTYWAGPEYRANVEAGKYGIIVSSTKNDSKYSLAVGEAELFDFPETMNALTLIPKIKRDFFDESPVIFILSPFGAGLIVIMYILAFIFGFVYRYIVRKFSRNTLRKVHKNIGQKDRMIRWGIGIFLLILAVTTSWSPILLFFSGFTFFEAIFSWCGLYAALGRNSCPIDSVENS